MTRHHFVALAAALAATKPSSQNNAHAETLNQWIADMDAIASVCERSNIRFDRTLFITACNAEVETV